MWWLRSLRSLNEIVQRSYSGWWFPCDRCDRRESEQRSKGPVSNDIVHSGSVQSHGDTSSPGTTDFFQISFHLLSSGCFFRFRLTIPWKFVLNIKTVTSLHISHKKDQIARFLSVRAGRYLEMSSLISNVSSAFWHFCCRCDRCDHYDQCMEGVFHIIATIATIAGIELSDRCRCDRWRVVSLWSLRSLNLFFQWSQRS